MGISERLYAKGWSPEEIAHFEQHKSIAHAQRDAKTVFADRFTYWFFLLCLIVGIIAFGLFFFKFLADLPVLLANLTVAFLACVFAVLFGHVLHELDTLTHGHHVLVLLVSAVTSVGSSWLILARSLRLGVLFAIVFSLLYGYYWYISYEQHKSA